MSKHTAGHHKTRPLATPEQAYQRGMRDRIRGQAYSGCPYSDKDLVFSWEAGWATQNGVMKLEAKSA